MKGHCTSNNLTRLSSIAFGLPEEFKKIPLEEISNLDAKDVKIAKSLGYKIKLLAIGKYDKAKKELDWEPKVHFEEGLRRYIEWYKTSINLRG